MQCVTPMFYYYKIGDKKHGKIVPRQEVLQSLKYDPNYIRECLKVKNASVGKTGHKYIQVPCNHCWACKLKYSAEWATRIMLEAKKYEHNYYVTLTYNDKYAPIAEKTSWEQYDKEPDGTITKTIQERVNDGTWGYTLDRPELVRFLSSLREKLAKAGHTGMKYYYCGEYGSQTKRPHYHMILINCPLDLKQFYDCKIDSNFKAHWKSKELEHLWAHGKTNEKKRETKGFIDVAELEWSCAAYVARYCTKKIDPNMNKQDYLEMGKMYEFVGMSKNIGWDYFNENYDKIYQNDEIIMKTVKGNVGSIKPPRAYDRKLQKINPKMYEKIKRSREKAAERSQKLIQSVTDATDAQILRLEASKLETKMQMLPRAGDW